MPKTRADTPESGDRGWLCPKCEHLTLVIDSRRTSYMRATAIRRRRECSSARCRHRFTTYELTAEQATQVISVVQLLRSVAEINPVAPAEDPK